LKTRSYLSGPMDFVGSRVIEKYLGWRAIHAILKAFSIRVLDPWNSRRSVPQRLWEGKHRAEQGPIFGGLLDQRGDAARFERVSGDSAY